MVRPENGSAKMELEWGRKDGKETEGTFVPLQASDSVAHHIKNITFKFHNQFCESPYQFYFTFKKLRLRKYQQPVEPAVGLGCLLARLASVVPTSLPPD